MHPTHLCASQSAWHRGVGIGRWDRVGEPCLDSSKVHPFLCRMPERASWNWSAGSWLLALCLAWLWTILASASLQPPTPTGLGVVARSGEGASQDT